MNLAPPPRRRLLQAGGGLLAAAGLLVAGGFIGNALADDGDGGGSAGLPTAPPEFDAGSSAGLAAPNPAASGGGGAQIPGARPAVTIATADGEESAPAIATDDVARGGDSYYYGFCQGSLAGVASPSSIDLSGTGFVMNLLPGSYALHSLNLRAEHDCEDEAVQWLVLDTSWTAPDSDYTVWISQRESDEPIANVLRQGWAELWHDGYAYSISVGFTYPYPIEPLDDVAIEEEGLPPREPDGEEMRAALLEVVRLIAPEIEERCFYRQQAGGWDALTALGIGDPRGAVPDGFVESGVWAEVYEPPAAGCDVPAEYEPPLNFNASWHDGAGGWLSVSAYRFDTGFEDPWIRQGYSSEHNVAWSTGGIRYEVYGNRGERGLGVETLETIARAMDPAFDESCRLVERELGDSDLAAAGIGVPVAPDGFELVRSRAVGSEANGNCDGDVAGYVSADWSYRNGEGVNLNASAWREPYGEGRFGGFIGYGYMSWQAANGVGYSVSVWSETGEGGDEDLLVAVALSMDPDLDVDALEREDGFPRPVDGVAVDEPDAE